MLHVVSFTETLHFGDVLLPNALTIEVAVHFVVTTDNSSFCIKDYNSEFSSARKV
jgi:hypothetical protein